MPHRAHGRYVVNRLPLAMRPIETYANESHLVVVTEYADGEDLGREIL